VGVVHTKSEVVPAAIGICPLVPINPVRSLSRNKETAPFLYPVEFIENSALTFNTYVDHIFIEATYNLEK